MKFCATLGVDVSKEWLDLCLIKDGVNVWQGKIDNCKSEIRSALSTLKQSFGLTLNQTLVVLESTGVYANLLLEVLWSKKVPTWVEHASHIKASIGMTRGKNDAIDAERIAMYGVRFQDKVRLWAPPRDIIRKLSVLSSMRSRLIRAKIMLAAPIKEMETYLTPAIAGLVSENSNPVIIQLNEQIKIVDQQIQELIEQDAQVSQKVNLITSIKGVGIVTAVALMVETNEFTKYEDAKKLACAAGVVPFEHSSGLYKSKGRVSPRANKKLKTLLQQCARSAIAVPGELRDYYCRKVAEGKHKMSVLNAVRNKILHRIFAVVRDNTMYDQNFQHMLA